MPLCKQRMMGVRQLPIEDRWTGIRQLQIDNMCIGVRELQYTMDASTKWHLQTLMNWSWYALGTIYWGTLIDLGERLRDTLWYLCWQHRDVSTWWVCDRLTKFRSGRFCGDLRWSFLWVLWRSSSWKLSRNSWRVFVRKGSL